MPRRSPHRDHDRLLIGSGLNAQTASAKACTDQRCAMLVSLTMVGEALLFTTKLNVTSATPGDLAARPASATPSVAAVVDSA